MTESVWGDALTELLLKEKELTASNQRFYCLSYSFLALPHQELEALVHRWEVSHKRLTTTSLFVPVATGQGLTQAGDSPPETSSDRAAGQVPMEEQRPRTVQTKGPAETDKLSTDPPVGRQVRQELQGDLGGSLKLARWLLAGLPWILGHKAGVVGLSTTCQGWAGSH